VRTNRTHSDAAGLQAELRERFPELEACRWAPDGLSLGRRGNPARDPAFLAGRYTVQDESSQLVAVLLDPQPGERILDTCAAPGTKTTAIAERLAGRGSVLALDRNASRLRLVLRDARRLGLGGIAIAQRDASEPLDDLAKDGGFDRVLVDAPCSGLGTLRRNPDARWRILPSDLEGLTTAQGAILASAADVLKPGGTLVYSTCTLLPEENEAIVDDFLRSHPDFRKTPKSSLPPAVADFIGDEGYMRCLPHLHGTDGFFAARLERIQ
jgi:16S rRNA (cytosine967-C5)-methyltransferase